MSDIYPLTDVMDILAEDPKFALSAPCMRRHYATVAAIMGRVGMKICSECQGGGCDECAELGAYFPE